MKRPHPFFTDSGRVTPDYDEYYDSQAELSERDMEERDQDNGPENQEPNE